MKSRRIRIGSSLLLANRAMPGVKMSGGGKGVQAGVRVKLPDGATWDSLAASTPEQVRERGLLPAGFMPLPHVKQATGGQVFPNEQIDEIAKQESRNLRRFDVDFDLPEQFTPEFPAPIFLNQTEDRKSADQSQGVTCLDCHTNFHTNAAFHLTPDVRPQSARFRLDTTSLRGLYNQQIHGSKRSLRSVEDFSEFEQRTAYFNGDHVSATRKGVNLPDRPNQVAMMAQMQNIIHFPPAPKLDPTGRLDPSKATPQELAGEQMFLGKGRCAQCHIPQESFMDQQMHDLHLERFYEPGRTVNDLVMLPDGPIKTFTLRGIKDSPPYMHDGRLLTLADTVEFFNLVMSLKLNAAEKDSLVAYTLAL